MENVKMPYRAARKIEAAQKRIREAYNLLGEAEEEIRKEFGDYVANVFEAQQFGGLYHGTCDWDDETLQHWVEKDRLFNG